MITAVPVEYGPGAPRIVYGDGDDRAVFVLVCPHCGRFVRADDEIRVSKWDGGLHPGPNATCRKCGRVRMPFEGFV
jgi:hypothetical protein